MVRYAGLLRCRMGWRTVYAVAAIQCKVMSRSLSSTTTTKGKGKGETRAGRLLDCTAQHSTVYLIQLQLAST